MNRRIFRRLPASRRGLIAVLAAAVAVSTALAIAFGTGTAASAASAAPARADQPPGESTGLGQLSGLLPRSNLTLQSAIEVNLSQEYVRQRVPSASMSRRNWCEADGNPCSSSSGGASSGPADR